MQAAHEQPGTDEQHYRERGLKDEQRRSRSRALVSIVAGARLEGRCQIGASGMQRRHHSGEHCRDERHDGGEKQRPAVGEYARRVVGRQEHQPQPGPAPLRNGEPGQAP